ncbi:hypothetical protein FHETE_8538 [Fusarium heterosporum]|uniref:2EXR domain-containing protein n=1 Tax=Fusarium heterosporum TaxID=42747 RepID=A0A8H5T2C2_FUSHE|nr:hypothetical protein FHETE_8538 [Fusarium heterosporum]
MSSSFPQFSKLPSEVRAAIWEAAIPPKAGIYMYSKQRPSDRLEERAQELKQQHRVQVPDHTERFYNTCKEARQAVQYWLKKNKIECNYQEETKSRVFSRDFDVDLDLFYVPRERWQTFLIDVMEESDENENDTEDKASATHIVSNIKRLALPAFTAYYSISNLAALLDWTKKLEVIYVVWDKLPKMEGVWDIASYPDPEDTVSIHHFDERTGREFKDEGTLEELYDEMEDMWSTSEINPEFWDEDEEKLRVPHIHVRVKRSA